MLPRRALLGAWLAPDLEAFSKAGTLVTGAVPGSMADRAGIRDGDRLTYLDGLPLRSLQEIAEALRSAGSREQVTLVFHRDGESRSATVAVEPTPREAIAENEVVYDHIDIAGVRLRTIFTRPLDLPPRGLILFVQGIACESVDCGADAEAPIAQLIRDWAKGGMMTLRMDKRGVGDSEGGPCSELGFETELSDMRRAFELACTLAEGHGVPLHLFGHSVGGMMAPLLTAEHPVDGIMVYGTSAERWLDIMESTTYRQRILRGASEEEAGAEVGMLRAQALSRGLNGRSAAYHGELHDVDLRQAWKSVQCQRLLILRGEHDWVVSAEEQAEIAELVSVPAQIVDVPGVDHLFGWHPDQASSLEHYGEGEYGPAAAKRMLEWLGAGPQG